MPQTIIFLGLVLCGQTVAALFLSNEKYPVEFLPLMLGVLALFGGVVSLNPHRRFHTGWALGAASALVGILAIARLGLLLRRPVFDRFEGDTIGWVASGLILGCAALTAVCFLMARTSKSRGRRTVLDGVSAGVDDAIQTPGIADSSVLPVVLATDDPTVAGATNSVEQSTTN